MDEITGLSKKCKYINATASKILAFHSDYGWNFCDDRIKISRISEDDLFHKKINFTDKRIKFHEDGKVFNCIWKF